MFFKSKDGTAQGVAKQRFIESLATPDKRIINDPYACEFVFGSGVVKMMGHNSVSGFLRRFYQVGTSI